MADPAPIVHFLYEPGDGGLDRVAIYLANGMANMGLPTELWLTKTAGPLAQLIAADVKVRKIPTPAVGGRGLRLFLQIPALAKMIRKHQPRAIFSAGNQSNLNIAIARKLAGSVPTKIIQKITNPIRRPAMSARTVAVRKFRFGKTIAMGDLCLALSEPDAQSYGRMFPASRQKIKAVCNAYVTPEMVEIGRDRPVGQFKSPVQLLAVGRIAVQKDYANMMYALAKVQDHSWELTVLGNGPLEAETKSLAQQLGLSERVLFKGFVSDPAPYYAAADILLLSSLWEGFAAVPLEAMMAGCHVVSTDNSAGLTHLLAAEGQQTVPVGNPSALAAAITNALENPPQSDLRNIAERYSLENSVEDHLRLLKQLEAQG